MARDSFSRLWRQVLLHCPVATPFLAQVWVNNSFRRLSERRLWSWLVREGQYILNDVVKTGTVTVTRNSASITGVGTAFTGAMVGRQFRNATNNPIYTIATAPTATTLTLDRVWGSETLAGSGYEIYNAYVTAPSDFHAYVSLWDPQFNWQLWVNVTQDELNSIDAQRAQSGTAWAVSALAYDLTSSPPLPRYEIWPHQKADYVYPFLYEARATDLEDTGAELPRYIRGDVLLEMALEECARWPGPSAERKNPYYSVTQSQAHQKRSEFMIGELERQDEEVYNVDTRYQQIVSMPWSIFPQGDASWLQRHALILPLAFTLGIYAEYLLRLVSGGPA